MIESNNSRDIALTPNANADTREEIEQSISEDILNKYDVYSYRHAATILKNSFPDHFSEIESMLRKFTITTVDIGIPGGNESDIPKKISALLRPLNWVETRIQGDLNVRVKEYTEEMQENGKLKKHTLPIKEPIVLPNYIDGHKIDYVKGKVALDMEWNSKDQTFDRDLYAFRTFYDYGLTNIAILITRSEKLNEPFKVIPQRDKKTKEIVIDKHTGKPKPCISKYGASTTWIGKLLYRLNAGRHGGCPVLVFCIRPEAIEDWPPKDRLL